MIAVTGAMTAAMTAVTGAMTAATGVPGPGCCGGNSRAVVLRLSGARSAEHVDRFDCVDPSHEARA